MILGADYQILFSIDIRLLICVHFRYICTFLLIWSLSKRAVILPPKIEELEFGGYIKSGQWRTDSTLKC